jgi:hypothetical protein
MSTTAIAYHEAGHCVMAIRRGVPVARVTIEPTGPYCRTSAAMGDLEANDVLMVLCAGAAAEAKYLGRAVALEGEDLDQALAVAGLLEADLAAIDAEHAALMAAVRRGGDVETLARLVGRLQDLQYASSQADE